MSKEVYQLTPKGWLAARTSTDDIDTLWADFCAFVQKRAEQTHKSGGIPTLIFEDGGICTFAEKIEAES